MVGTSIAYLSTPHACVVPALPISVPNTRYRNTRYSAARGLTDAVFAPCQIDQLQNLILKKGKKKEIDEISIGHRA
eukprot:1680796-Rhodomonas_salina.2